MHGKDRLAGAGRSDDEQGLVERILQYVELFGNAGQLLQVPQLVVVGVEKDTFIGR